MANFSGSTGDDEFSTFGNSDGIIGDPAGLTALTDDGDLILGRGGDDTVYAGDGTDTVRGGEGGPRDTVIGGEGDDVFRPNDDSFAPVAERIGVLLVRAAYNSAVPAFEGAGEAGGDSIDLRFVDANRLTDTQDANEAFIFGGEGRGHVWLGERGTQTLILMNTDNDAQAEFRIAIDDGAGRASDYTVDDFILI